jgi:hypothetical protein
MFVIQSRETVLDKILTFMSGFSSTPREGIETCPCFRGKSTQRSLVKVCGTTRLWAVSRFAAFERKTARHCYQVCRRTAGGEEWMLIEKCDKTESCWTKKKENGVELGKQCMNSSKFFPTSKVTASTKVVGSQDHFLVATHATALLVVVQRSATKRPKVLEHVSRPDFTLSNPSMTR